MKDILLINPPLYFSGGRPHTLDTTTPPLGLLYLASYLRKHSRDFRVRFMDVAPEGLPLADIKRRVESIDPFVIGLTSMTPQLQGTVELAEMIKKETRFDGRIFLGGPHVSADPGFIDRNSGIFDYAITGEAEKTFLDSLNKLQQGQEIPRIQAGEPIQDLDAIPFPDRSLAQKDKYIREDHAKALFLLISRGCPFHCYFCSSPAVDNRKVRYRSPKNIIAEIKQGYEHCGGYLTFADDTLTMNRDIVMELCQEIEREGLRLHWRCNTRIDLVDGELLRAMKRAGCEAISFGIESANERIRRDMVGKGSFANERVYEVVRMCRALGISVNGNFILGNPTETLADIRATKKMIFDLKIDGLSLTVPSPFPGSRLYEMAKSDGMINEEIMDRFAHKALGEGYSGIYPIYTSKAVSREQVLKEMRDIHRRFYITFKNLRIALRRDLLSMSNLATDAKALYYLLTRGGTFRKPYIKY